MNPLLLTPLLIAAAASQPANLRVEAHEFRAATATVAAELGTLRVPQRHDRPDGPSFELKFVRLPRLGKNGPAVAPVVYLAGGPGGSGIEAARGPRFPVFQAVREVADVILLDQRGTGLSQPAPRCPRKFEPAPDQPGDPIAMGKTLNTLARDCARFWKEADVDLNAYTTVESAHDLEDLRVALDVPKLNLWGMSYGTHLALATLRAHGPHIERVVLMGTEGLHQTLKPPLQADRLLADLSLKLPESAGGRDLPALAKRVFERLAAKPVIVEFPAGSGMPPKVALSAFDVQLASVLALGTTQYSRTIPALFAQMDQGDFKMTAGFVLQTRARIDFLMNAMPLAMDIASGASPARLKQIADEEKMSVFGPALNFPFPGISEGLGVADLGEDFRAPLKSSVPTLFVSGTLDGRTPPDNAEEVRKGFSHGAHLVLDGAGHENELFLATPELGQRIAGFFAGSETKDEVLKTPLW